MNMSDYQKAALNTDQAAKNSEMDVVLPLLGLAGEVGQLLSEYKKHIRSGDTYHLFDQRVSEELGDLLWYLSNTASKFGLDLGQIAEQNLKKCGDRWVQGKNDGQMSLDLLSPALDEGFSENERLPRQMLVKITDYSDGRRPKMQATINGKPAGDYLTDNSYTPDGYRFHDIFHLSYAAVLGWSPVVRSNLKCKRKSNNQVDEVEDGGRAIVIEEGISVLVFNYASKHGFLDGITEIDYELLRTIKGMTAGLEVSKRSMADWEKAIVSGYEVWRKVEKNRGGTIVVDLDDQTISYVK